MKKITQLLMTVLVLASCGASKEPQPQQVAAPATPSRVALHGTAGETSLTFQWDAVQGASRYDWKLLQSGSQVKDGSVNQRNVTISGLTKGTSYQFSVCAVNEGGASAWSTHVEAATLGSQEPENPEGPVASTIDYADFSIPAIEEADGLARAFPGAEGGGMFTTGGRGGKVYHVTNLKDSGEGSLRWALGQDGARTVVFDVAGIIELDSHIQITKGDLTIAGQTAPGDGICIKNYTVNISASNVIVRFLHFRLGDEGPNAGDGEDCIWGRYNNDLILDHCSMSWSIDECASFYANENFTMQWCILTESMNNSAHSKGAHGYGGIWGGKNASFHHNLLANHHSRNPRIDHPEIYPKKDGVYDWSKRGNVDLRNLVIYNWGDNSSYGGEGGWFNYVNCWYKPGPDSKDRHYFVDAYKLYNSKDYNYPSLFMSGNVNTAYDDISSNNGNGIYWHNGGSAPLAQAAHSISGPSGEKVYTTTQSAEAGKDAVLEWAGDRLHRDAVDERAVKGVRENSGRIINTPADVGGWPAYSGETIVDTDHDGIPDAIEKAWGMDSGNAADGSAKTIDPKGRYTNLEMYLHYLVKDIVAGGNNNGNYTQL